MNLELEQIEGKISLYSKENINQDIISSFIEDEESLD